MKLFVAHFIKKKKGRFKGIFLFHVYDDKGQINMFGNHPENTKALNKYALKLMSFVDLSNILQENNFSRLQQFLIYFSLLDRNFYIRYFGFIKFLKSIIQAIFALYG